MNNEKVELVYDPQPCPAFGYRCSKCNALHTFMSYADVPLKCKKCESLFANAAYLKDGY